MKRDFTPDEAIGEEWTEKIGKHRTAIGDYLQIASEITEQVWRLPVGAEKWTPAQITGHLILTY